ncbi:hypothetical protein IAR55_000903 [Kwoniella newhampshirensis]|uniref:Uncharacterized protein n=1 Tax=Kwoniella newhampshirensis TaxID=1651941 RepID=A0AAW0Z463_9TREE
MSAPPPPPQPFKTDSLNPASLPRATLGLRRHPGSGPSASSAGGLFTDPNGASSESISPDERAKRALEKEYERWNERIDKEMKGVVQGLKDLVALADISPNPSPLTSSTLPLHLPLRTSSLIRSTLNIRDIAHELKLLLLLSDEEDTVRRRDYERALVRVEVENGRKEVVSEVAEVLGSGAEVHLDEGLGEKIGSTDGTGEETMSGEKERRQDEGKGVGEGSAGQVGQEVIKQEEKGDVLTETAQIDAREEELPETDNDDELMEEVHTSESVEVGEPHDELQAGEASRQVNRDQGGTKTSTRPQSEKAISVEVAPPTEQEKVPTQPQAESEEQTDVDMEIPSTSTAGNDVGDDKDEGEDDEDDFEEVS